MLYLGVNVSHNVSATLALDGEIIVAVQEKKLTKIKNFTGIINI